MKTKKPKLQGLVHWGDVHVEMSIQKCPDCAGFVRDLRPLGFYLSVCDKCKKFWSLRIVDVTSELVAKFKKENLR